MSFGRLSYFWKTISFRLWLRYAAIFIAIALLILTISHIWLSSVLKNNDQRGVKVELKELTRLYQEGGLEAVVTDARTTDRPDESDSFFVRVANPQNETLMSNAEPYEDFDLDLLESAPGSVGVWTRVPEKVQDDEIEFLKSKEFLEVYGARLQDANFLQVGRSTEYREDFLANVRLIFAAIVTPLFLLIGTLLSLRSLRPLRAMIHTVRMIQDGKMETRVPTRNTGDELDQLAKLFNEMLERIENLIRGMRNSMDAVAHDLRTPITRLRVVAESALQSEPNCEKYQEALADCLEESDRIDKLLNILMDISEAETGSMKLNLESVSVPALIQDSAELYRYIAEGKNIQITTKYPDDLLLRADWNRMRQVLANLLDNAIKYTDPGGQVQMEAFRNGHQTIILIKDTGIGISSEELPLIWDRLYRGDNTRSQKGIGLGLSLVRAVVKAHGGMIEATSETGKGSEFKLMFPM